MEDAREAVSGIQDDSNMNCPNCNQPTFIDEWSGWVWTCVCGHIGRPATKEEIKELENEALDICKAVLFVGRY
jgi:RNA polymerase subunit RPABC4/transcription elongation factor Spt4